MGGMPVIVSAPPGAGAAELTPAQRAVVERPLSAGHLLVLGAPGTGKTTTALATFRRRLEEEGHGGVRQSRHVLLAPSRRAAASLRDQVSRSLAAAPGGAARRLPLVHTPSAFAFAVVRAFAVAQGRPVPALITGAQQDRILAEIIAGHAARTGAGLLEGLPAEGLATAAFRHELRDLFMRAAEFGLTPAELAAAGRELERPEWVAAAALLREYRDVVALSDATVQRGERYDAAAITSEAATILRDWEEFTHAPPPRFDSVVVDDHQESSAAVVRLLHALADRGAALTLFADPDVAVQVFRGARPHFVGRAPGADLGGFGAATVVLPEAHRGSAALRELVRAVTDRVPSAGAVAHRAAQVPAERRAGEPPVGMPPVRVACHPSPAAEHSGIAHALRSAHLYAGLGWDRLAVVVRSSAARRAVADALRAREVPVAPDPASLVLGEERAVRPLLVAVEAAGGLTAEQATELLLGPMGGFDPVSLRRLRRHVRARLRTGEFGLDAGVDDAVVQLLESVPGAQTLPGEVREGVVRVARVLRAVRDALADPAATHQSVLWRAWDASQLAGAWQRLALAGGPAGERADADLDAVMALFTAAENHAERNALSRPLDFVAQLRGEELPSDTLAASGQRPPGVEVLTVAQAAGREWDLVVVAGVQEDSWPDTRVRDTLLGAGALADAELGRIGMGQAAAARHEVVGDEWRLFAAALSRARRAVLVTAVADEDRRPSIFFEAVAARAGAVAEPGAVERLDLRGLVATLRAELEAALGAAESPAAGEEDSRRVRDCAALLAALAGAGVQGADPAEWAGAGPPTCLTALRRPDRPVWVSPSKVESVTTCPLRWALETTGGRSADRIEQTLGSLVHEIAAAHPHGTPAELRAALDERFDSLGLRDGWVRTRERRRAERMLELFADYAVGIPGPVLVEQEIRQQVGDAVVHGFVDRVELVDGGVRLADLKTGRPIPVGDAEQHAQLGIYQLAAQAGALGDREPAGARLVHLFPERTSAALRAQPPLPPDGGWARELLAEAVGVMRAGRFDAVAGPACRHCSLRTSCPVAAEGARCAR